MDRVSKATGARVQTTVNGLNPAVLGTCSSFEERQVSEGSNRVHKKKGTGACVQTIVNSLNPTALGTCSSFEGRQMSEG